MALDGIITTAEACAILGDDEPLDRSTISRWVQIGKLEAAGKLPGRNGAFLFDRRKVEELKRRNDAESAAPAPPPSCGTYAGHQAHRRRGEDPCRECLRANTEYKRKRRVAQRESRQRERQEASA